MKAIKKYDPIMSPKLEFIVYDAYFSWEPQKEFIARFEEITELLSKDQIPENIKLLPFSIANSTEDLLAQHAVYTNPDSAIAYEGMMVRLDAAYTPGQRSSALLKHKDFLDSEYLIVDVVEGEGLYKGCGIFVCQTETEQRFNVTPKTSIADKQEIFQNKQTYIGQQLKVKYQCLSDTGIPRFPVGLIREEIEG